MEIGSEFSLERGKAPCIDSIFSYLRDYSSIYTDSGRSALRLLLPFLPPGPILLPAYLCESVYRSFQKRKLLFYEITDDLEIDWSDLFGKLEYGVSVVYLHYFNGVVPEKEQLEKLLSEKKKRNFLIIEDTTHSIFSHPLTAGDYGVCSLRKWFPIPDGGVLYSGTLLRGNPDELQEAEWPREKMRAMKLKAEYLDGKRGEDCNIEYRHIFASCEQKLGEQTRAFGMSALSGDILKKCSISEMVNKRLENYRILANSLKKLSSIQLLAQPGVNDCPLVCPVGVSNRDALRSFLISNRVYCAVHWPESDMPTKCAAQLAKCKHSLPVDQRYGSAEMLFLADKLLQYKGNGSYAEID